MSANEEIIIRAVLAGTREYLANSQAVVAGNEEIAASTDATAAAMGRATRRGYLMNQALFTVRRLMYGVTLATVASGVMAVKWGWQFNSAMQQARVALAPVFGDTQALTKELNYLFNFTKYTPFQFKDVTAAFRMLYAAFQPIGISVDETNQTIKSLTDSLAYAGKVGPGQLNRVALALQHMAYQGHLTGYAVNQLSRDGIPMLPILRKEFGLTGDEIHKVGTLGIPVLDVLKAINHYIATTPGFQNAARRQALMTFHGQFTTFKDNMGQIMGAVEKGWFSHLQGLTTRANLFLGRAGQVLQKGGSITDVLRMAGGNSAVLLWNRLVDVLRQFWLLFSTIVSAVGRSKVFWGAMYGILLLISGVLHAINPLLQAFGGTLVGLLIPALITWYGVTKIAAFWTGLLTLEEVLATKATKDLSFWQFLAAVATGRYALATKAAALGTYLMTTAAYVGYTAQYALSAAILMVRDSLIVQYLLMKTATAWSYLYTAGLYAISVAEYVVAAAMRTEATAAVIAWAATLGPIALVLAGLAAIAAAIFLIIRYWQQFKDATASIAFGGADPAAVRQTKPGPQRSFWSGVWHSVTHLPGSAGSGIPGMATGGSVLGAGLSWVGERGPELLSLPVGATVIPRQQAMAGPPEAWRNSGVRERQPIKVMIGRKVLVDIVAEEVATQLARS